MITAQSYIDNFATLKALGFAKSAQISISDLTRAVIQSVDDLITLTLPDDGTRRDTVLAGVGTIFDRLAAYLPITWKPFTPVVRYLLVSYLAPRLYDYLVANEPTPLPVPPVTPDPPVTPVNPSEPTVIHVDPDTGLPQALLVQQQIAADLDKMKEAE